MESKELNLGRDRRGGGGRLLPDVFIKENVFFIINVLQNVKIIVKNLFSL